MADTSLESCPAEVGSFGQHALQAALQQTPDQIRGSPSTAEKNQLIESLN